MMSVEEARARILVPLSPLAPEWVTVTAAHGRALAADIVATRTQPPADVSAMDGYALRAADAAQVPVTLRVIGAAPAGHAFAGAVGASEAVRIFTGGVVPPGADAIVIQEDTEASADGASVTIREAARPGRHIRRKGYDFEAGRLLLNAGRRLSAADIALIASANVLWVAVRRAPRVAILATGDELVRPGESPQADQIVSSNNAGLAALVRAAGGEPIDIGLARDEPAAIASAATGLHGADMVVTIGGASVGEHDLVQKALAAHGLVVDFWKIAMRPGKPLMSGHLQGRPFLGLPGNPVSALVCALLFLRPALLALQGLATDLPTATALLGSDLPANDKRADYLRARLALGPSGAPIATPFPVQDSAMLSALAQSDALVLRAPGAPAAAAGTPVPILPLAGLW